MERILSAIVLCLLSGLASANWQQAHRTIDPMTDSVEGMAYLWSTDGVAALGFRCGRRFDNDGLEVFIGFHGWLSFGKNEIRYRIDGGPIETLSAHSYIDEPEFPANHPLARRGVVPAFPLPTGLKLYDNDEQTFLGRIRKSNKLIVELVSKEQRAPWIFELEGIEDALNAHCPTL